MIWYIALFIVGFSNLGFPYSPEGTVGMVTVAPQRLMVYHTERTFYDAKGEERFRDVGISMERMDYYHDEEFEQLVEGYRVSKKIQGV